MVRHPLTAAVQALLAIIVVGPAIGDAAQAGTAVAYYDISGDTADALRNAMSSFGPIGADGRRWDGYTAWRLEIAGVQFHQGDDFCRVAEVLTPVDVRITLPRWHAPANADPALLEKWRRYTTALERHEQGHERIAYDTAAAIERRVSRMGRFATCPEAEAAARKAAARIIDKARAADATYDRKTHHGARQGARFP